MKISQRVSKLLSGHNFHSDIFKGALFPKMKVKFKFLLSAHRPIMLYICTKFYENISMCLGLLSGHDFHLGICYGALFHKDIGRVMVLALCTLADDAL